MIDPAEIKTVVWSVSDPEPLRKLYWFCRDDRLQPWVEVMPTERLLNNTEVMSLVKRAIFDFCGPGGEVMFAGDSQLYYVNRVELRVAGVIEEALKFHPDLVQLDRRILIRIVTLSSIPASPNPKVVDRHMQRGVTLERAIEFAEQLATTAAKNGGLIVFSPDPGLHSLDRIEVYYDGEFKKVIPLDYGSFLGEPDDVN